VTYAIVTFGCRVNQADSMAIEDELRARGDVPAPATEAHLVVVNTCSVTASADQGARQTIRRIARSNPGAKIVVTGCYATRRPEELRALPGVTSVVANDGKPRLVQFIRTEALNRAPAEPAVFMPEGDELTTAERFGDGEGACGRSIEPGVAGRTAFTLRVQTGCSEPCSYCIIPTTRGRPRSLPIHVVLGECERAGAAGFKEIVLTGVHLGSYGRDLAPSTSLLALCRALAREAPPDRLYRVSSLEPMDCQPALVDFVAEHSCFAPHFHLPLQHASNRTLAAMQRPYTLERYGALVDRIRTTMPLASIGSDVIVGFPGEGDEDFEMLASYARSSPLTHLHVFPYSDRPGTAASRMGGKVAGSLVRARASRMRCVGEGLALTFRASQSGTVHRALTLEDGTRVVTPNYLKARIPAGVGRNHWVRVRITDNEDAELLDPAG
jgi:threonylcarbamoyladenosine tRNA methylthiotransferase MtaB